MAFNWKTREEDPTPQEAEVSRQKKLSEAYQRVFQGELGALVLADMLTDLKQFEVPLDDRGRYWRDYASVLLSKLKIGNGFEVAQALLALPRKRGEAGANKE